MGPNVPELLQQGCEVPGHARGSTVLTPHPTPRWTLDLFQPPNGQVRPGSESQLCAWPGHLSLCAWRPPPHSGQDTRCLPTGARSWAQATGRRVCPHLPRGHPTCGFLSLANHGGTTRPQVTGGNTQARRPRACSESHARVPAEPEPRRDPRPGPPRCPSPCPHLDPGVHAEARPLPLQLQEAPSVLQSPSWVNKKTLCATQGGKGGEA